MSSYTHRGNNSILLVVAVALIRHDGFIFLAQRPPHKPMPYTWEFPGGKLHDGETPEEALIREVREEIAISIDKKDLHPLSFISHPMEEFHILMPLYACFSWKGCPKGAEGQNTQWVEITQLDTFPLLESDRILIPHLKQALKKVKMGNQPVQTRAQEEQSP